jgi:hypothetical protein
VVTPNGEIADEFKGRACAEDVKDQWVRDNIVPVCVNLPTFGTRQYLRDRFWAFWLRHRETCLCVGDFGAPVEALLFRKCIEDVHQERMWLGPYPMHELGTALLLAGVDPDVNRIEYAGAGEVKKHNPLDDAAVAAACWLKATHNS